MVSLESCARCDYVVLAVPVQAMASVLEAIAPHLRPGATVIDVASVKVKMAALMLSTLPEYVQVIGTHPLFGPESAREGVKGHRIAICPIRAPRSARVFRFLQRGLGLDVILTTPEEHDRDMATVQGLTHLVAKALTSMGPLPTSLTTQSFSLLAQAAAQVSGDSDALFRAIEHDNPYAATVRAEFLKSVQALAGTD